MMLLNPPSCLFENINIRKTSNYVNKLGKNPKINTLMHPCFIVFSKNDLVESSWLFICKDKDAVEKLKLLQNYNGPIWME